MTVATMNSANAYDAVRRYVTDVSNAARALVEALFAARNRAFVARKVALKPAPRAKVGNRLSALVMANDYSTMHPQLAARLRELARA